VFLKIGSLADPGEAITKRKKQVRASRISRRNSISNIGEPPKFALEHISDAERALFATKEDLDKEEDQGPSLGDENVRKLSTPSLNKQVHSNSLPNVEVDEDEFGIQSLDPSK